MCIHLFNPPAPSCEPTKGGIDENSGQRCGSCVCVPRYWEAVNPLSGDPYGDLFLGHHVLSRDLAAFRKDTFQDCEWSIPIPIQTGFVGSITLTYTTIGDGQIEWAGWWVIVKGLPAIGATPADVEIYGPLSGVGVLVGTTPLFNCLGPNAFPHASAFGSGGIPGIPDTFTVQPFWP